MKIPLGILLISKTYSVINYKKKYDDNETKNLAKGEIEKFNLKNSIYDGEKVLRQDWDSKGNEYNTIWVHLGKNYFKQISKTLDNRTC